MARVADADLDLTVFCGPGSDGQFPSFAFPCRLHGISDEVQENLLHLDFVNRQAWQIAPQYDLEVDVFPVEFEGGDGDRFFHHVVDVYLFALDLAPLEEGPQPADDSCRPAHLVAHFADDFGNFLAGLGTVLLEQLLDGLHVEGRRGQRLLELVGQGRR